MPEQYVWLFWSVAFLVLWLIAYVAFPRQRQIMFWASLLTMPFGLTEPLFVPAYWNPPSLFNLAQKTGFDIESLIFSFGIGGIGAILHNLLTGRTHAGLLPVDSSVDRLTLRYVVQEWAPAVPMVTFPALYLLPWNPIYPAIFALGLGFTAAAISRPELWFKIGVGAILFGVYYGVFLLALQWTANGYVEKVWNLPALSGIGVAGVPIEELIFAAVFGAYWSSAYEPLAYVAKDLNRPAAVTLVGLILATIMTILVAGLRDLSAFALAMALMVTIAASIFYAGLTAVSRASTSNFRYIAIAIGSSIVVFWLLGKSIPAHLDLLAVWLAMVMVAARLGCLLRGCCHGRPSQFGIVYNGVKESPGVAPYYLGVRLFPVQAIEAGVNTILAGVILVQLWTSGAAGMGFATYVVGYSTCRFALEFIRGDAGRYFFLALSGAQWSSIFAAASIIALEFLNCVPSSEWHRYALLLVLISAVVLGIVTRCGTTLVYRVQSAPHLAQLAQAVKFIDRSQLLQPDAIDNVKDNNSAVSTPGKLPPVMTFRTSVGLELAGSRMVDHSGYRTDYQFRFANGQMLPKRIADLVHNILLHLKNCKEAICYEQDSEGSFRLVISSRHEN